MELFLVPTLLAKRRLPLLPRAAAALVLLAPVEAVAIAELPRRRGQAMPMYPPEALAANDLQGAPVAGDVETAVNGPPGPRRLPLSNDPPVEVPTTLDVASPWPMPVLVGILVVGQAAATT